MCHLGYAIDRKDRHGLACRWYPHTLFLISGLSTLQEVLLDCFRQGKIEGSNGATTMVHFECVAANIPTRHC